MQSVSVAVVKDTELGAPTLQFCEVKGGCECLNFMTTTLDNGAPDGVNNNGGTCIMGILVVANTIDTYQITLVLDGTCTSKHLPSRLTRLWPVSHTEDNIVFTIVSIAAPTGETQVVASQQQQPKATKSDYGMLLPGGIILVFVAIREKVVFIIVLQGISPSVSKIMTVTIGAVRQLYGQTAADSTLVLTSRFPHPVQGSIAGLRTCNALWLCGKSCTPHFWQHVEVCTRLSVYEPLGFADIFIRLRPTYVGL